MKLSFAAFALLYSSQFTQGIKIQKHEKPDAQLVAMPEMDAPAHAALLEIPNVDLAQFAPDVDIDLEETEYLQTESKVGFSPGSCWAGIKRWAGASNSMKTIKDAQHAGTPWEDPDFPADATSLRWDQFGFGQQANINTHMVWKRPSQMGHGWTDQPSFFGDLGYPASAGVRQMGVADCWFLAGTSAVAEDQDRIMNVMFDKEYNSAGAFRFYFFVRNEWVGINVDDRVPVTSWGSGFRPFATWASNKNAWWMPLLEKAYAKLNQNYDRIAWGRGSEAIRTLTGAPTAQLQHGGVKAGNLQKMHKYWAAMNYPQTASCCNAVSGGIDGLMSGHAYSLLDVVQLKGGPLVAKMRNPWSKESYNGKFSDKDSSWTDAWKKQVDLKVADDGVFFMPYANYQKFFQATSVGFTLNYKHRVYPIPMSKRTLKFKISNPVDQHLYITAETYSHRHFPRATKCIPKHETVLYFQKPDGSNVDEDIPYAFVKWDGFGTVGNFKGTLPAGDYYLWMVDQAGDKTELSLHLYANHEAASLISA